MANQGDKKKTEAKAKDSNGVAGGEIAEKLNVQDYKQGIVYLFQFPRAECVPSISPFCLKLETWLRIAGVKYENVTSFTLRSQRGQMPFVEYNGKHYADSDIVVKELSREMGIFLEANLDAKESADAVAYGALISEAIFWASYVERYDKLDEIFGEKCQGKGFPSWPTHLRLLNKAIVWRFRSQIKSRLSAHGIGKYSYEEAMELGKTYLKALNTFLGEKKFLNGDKASTIDATAFGFLGQIYFPPVATQLKLVLEEECTGLVKYLERLRDEFWPDWDDATKKVQPNTEWMKKQLATEKTAE